jgi:hypothetical protein
MPWQPLLDGALKDSALESVQAILDDLSPFAEQPTGDTSLASGSVGLALLYGYCEKASDSCLASRGASAPGGSVRNPNFLPLSPGVDAPRFATNTGFLQKGPDTFLARAIAAVQDEPGTASLYGGLAGLGWAITHLQQMWPGMGHEDDLTEIDAVLWDHVRQSPWNDNYDLINGLVGFGVYALERLDRPQASMCLERVIDHLARTTQQHGKGITWWTSPAWLPPETRAKLPHGYYNLGLAHGVPGVIALLGCACAAGIAAEKARPLLDGAVRWLLAHDSPDGFHYFVGPDISENKTRLAWCYGDPGVAAALLGASRAVDEPDWECHTLAIARRAVERPPEESGVVDPGLCHGAAGLGHLFNRMFQATREPWLAEAARFWFQRTLTMRQPGRGIGGFAAWQAGDDGVEKWVADPGLLTGVVGVALALLAATTDIEPAWDRMLLLAIPPSITP